MNNCDYQTDRASISPGVDVDKLRSNGDFTLTQTNRCNLANTIDMTSATQIRSLSQRVHEESRKLLFVKPNVFPSPIIY